MPRKPTPILTQHADMFSSDLSQLSNQMQNAKATQNAWNITQQGFAVKMAQAQQAVNGVMEEIGTQLLPVLGKTARTDSAGHYGLWEVVHCGQSTERRAQRSQYR